MSHQRRDSEAVRVRRPAAGKRVEPMETVEIDLSKGLLGAGTTVHVLDGAGRPYVECPAAAAVTFQAGGALGRHSVLVQQGDRLLGTAHFQVDCATKLEDGGDWFSHFLQTLRYSITNSGYLKGRLTRYNGKLYTYYSRWIYDHVYAALGQQYYEEEIKDAIDLFADGQREDGMVYDNYKHDYSHCSSWQQRFDYGDFVKVPEDPHSSCIWVRIPLENSNEYHFIEGLYRAWKATGDTVWMKDKLDACLKAVQYSTTDPYRWSEKYQMLKKGYSIDMWDFQSRFDAARVGGDVMKVTLEDTHFNIFYGDNVRMAQSCHYLGEMLEYVGRDEEAQRMHRLGDDLKRRIDELSWTGTHYQHMVPIEPGAMERDFGVDTAQQVTMHNAWVLNRGATQEQCRAIIRTYQRIREEMPGSSPGEWYTCYPPFERGWNAPKWHYMNGGVSPIGAGELARGALEHGFERYGVDVLRRVYELAGRRGYMLHGCYKGAIPDPPPRRFSTVPLDENANTDLRGDVEGDVPGWTGEDENDLRNMPTGRQTFHDIPFDVLDPAENDRRACVGISRRPEYAESVEIPLGQKAASIYLLHTKAGGNLVGHARLIYADGTEHLHYIADRSINGDGPAIGGWWYPDAPERRKGIPHLKVAWRGRNPVAINVGVYVYGYANPHPEKVIEKIRFETPEGGGNSIWLILGVTLSDAEVFFTPSILSGIPRQWAAGEVMYGLFEGLIGVQDAGVAFDRARIVPRWEAAGKDRVDAVVKYAASGGYVAYRYRKDENDGRTAYTLTFTGNAAESVVELLLPEGEEVSEALLDGQQVEPGIETIEASRYAVLPVEGIGVHTVTLRL